MMTANHAVNAIPVVVCVKPGLLGRKDLENYVGRCLLV